MSILKSLRIAIIGSRGIPARYGGFETFAERLSVGLAGKNREVIVYCASFLKNEKFDCKGVKRIFITTPRLKSLSKFVLSSFSLIHATLIERPGVIIVLSTSGGPLLWLPKIFKKKIVLTFDGIEWARLKWNKTASLCLKLFELLSVKFADVIVADSVAIGQYIKGKYNKESKYIPYGSEACIYEEEDWEQVKGRFSVSPNSYYLVVGRFVPENSFDLIIKGYVKSNSKKKLLIITDYKPSPTIQQYLLHRNILLGGPIYDRKKLFALRKNAFAYIHGHTAGGTNPSLIEAIASDNLIICIDVPYNREVMDQCALYFKNENDLKNQIEYLEGNRENIEFEEIKKYYKRILHDRYNWKRVCDSYFEVIKSL